MTDLEEVGPSRNYVCSACAGVFGVERIACPWCGEPVDDDTQTTLLPPDDEAEPLSFGD